MTAEALTRSEEVIAAVLAAFPICAPAAVETLVAEYEIAIAQNMRLEDTIHALTKEPRIIGGSTVEKLAVYVGAKIIKACPMSKHAFRDRQGNEADGKPDQDGYFVVYPDGYESWSPKDAFETAYRLISDGEKLFFDPA